MGSGTRVVDLKGRMVLQGLGDVHNYRTMAAQQDIHGISFLPSYKFKEILACVTYRAAKIDPDEWITRGNWSSALVHQLETPEALAALDKASSGKPVVLRDDAFTIAPTEQVGRNKGPT